MITCCWLTAKSARQNKSVPEHEEVKAEETNRQQNNNLQWEINRSISMDCYRNVELEVWEEAKHGKYVFHLLNFNWKYFYCYYIEDIT